MSRPRQERGEQRRTALLEAALRLVGAGGPLAATHRAIAREAGLPLAATTYYFASREDLLLQTLTHAARHDVLDLRAALAGDERPTTPEQAAGVLCRAYLDSQRAGDGPLALFEIFLESARREPLRPAAREWSGRLVALVADQLADLPGLDPAVAATAALALLDGWWMSRLAQHDDLDPQAAVPVLAALLRGLQGV